MTIHSLNNTGRTYANRFRVGVPQYSVDFDATLADMISRVPPRGVIAELGAGCHPLLADEPRITGSDVTYFRVDISRDELSEGAQVGIPVVADVASETFILPAPADLIVSKMLAEHVASGKRFLKNVQRSLKPAGMYLQLSPVLYTMPFIANRLLSERASSLTLRLMQTKERAGYAKFPAPYSWCRGPSDSHLTRIRNLGFEIVAARGYFGHGYYRRIRPLHGAEKVKSAWLARYPIPALCSFTVLLLRSPDQQPSDLHSNEAPRGAGDYTA